VAKRGKTLGLAVIVLAAAVFVFTRNSGGGGPAYAPYTAGEMGTSLFFDTLRHMGLPVSVEYAPLTRKSDTRHVYILVQPYNPAVTQEMAEEMLEWVQRGGHLVFLHGSQPTVIDRLLAGTQNRAEGDFLHYTAGLGTVVTGQAYPLTNLRLTENAAPAAALHNLLAQWSDAERFVFPAYYYGVHPPETMFSRLPMVVRLAVIQPGIAALALLWHLGKRLGKPIPAYEETEREENEHVRALARLYTKTQRKGKDHDKNHSG
jgi:hypothetical protein